MMSPDSAFFQFLDQPALVLYPDGRIALGNEAFRAQFGPWKEGERLQHGLSESGQEALQQVLQRLGDAPVAFVHSFAPKGLPDRRWSWQFWERDGLVYGRARPAGQLPEGSLLFSALFNSPAIGLGMLDGEGILADVNEAFSSLLGYHPDDMRQTRGLDYVHRPDRKIIRDLEDSLNRNGSSRYEATVRLKKKNNRLLWTVLTVNSLRKLTGEPLLLIAVQDIDQRVKAEQKLKSRADELARSNKELEQFAFVASHDLQQPLRTISNFLQLLERKYSDTLEDEAREYVRHGVEGSQRMQRMIRDLLAYSRVQRIGEDRQFIDVNEVLEEVNINLQETAEAHTANVLSEYMPMVKASRRQLVQLFQNLIENAIKFSASGRRPEVIISAADLPNKVRFAVRDNGIGIPPESREKIFSLFQRLHEREDVEGTGIGLAVCQRIVENHGGRIWVESEPGKGSTFYFTVKKQ